MTGLFLGMALVITLGVFGFGLYYSNRIAGPLYRLQKYLGEFNNGQRPTYPLAFRKNDYFKEVADSVNQYFGTAKPSDKAPTDP